MDLWVDKYRPKTIDDYVFTNDSLRDDVEGWIKNGQVSGHLMLSGHQGCGKTALARLLFVNVMSKCVLSSNKS